MFENHLRFTEKVRVCQKRSPGDGGGPTPYTPSVAAVVILTLNNYSSPTSPTNETTTSCQVMARYSLFLLKVLLKTAINC